MTVLPAAAALVALAFSVHLFVRSARRGTWYEAVWGVAMLMFAVASAALTVGVADGWSSGEFRFYWLFGAVLNVPFLAQGEVYLLIRQRWLGHLILALVLAASVWATVAVRTAPLDAAVLAGSEFFTGREVLGAGSLALDLARIYSFGGYGVLVAGALWSAWQLLGRPQLRPRFYGVLLIVGGATVVAAGSAFAAAGNLTGFSLTLAAGIAVMYWGFLLSSRPTRRGETGRSP